MKAIADYRVLGRLVLFAALALPSHATILAAEVTSPGATPTLIPQPVRCRMTDGRFVFSRETRIVAAGALDKVATLAEEQLGIRAGREGKADDRVIDLAVDSSLAPEGYRLDITPDRITIAGGSPIGVFYAVQTLRQIIGPAAVGDSVKIPCLSIQDHPRFAWRGLMLDCSRTFQSIEYLKKTIDRLAFYKLNTLHLHLTDDQGWRVEIKKHPELTQKGARFSAKYNEPQSHQGFYTQQELRELVSYAADRGVTIVPEIEMPGHSRAALVCRPDLSCTGAISDDVYPFFKGPGITRDIFCAGNEDSFAFLDDVLDEVMEIFPSKFIHVGGDEAPKDRWKACPKCQARIKAEHLKDEHELQNYFMRRIEKHLNAKTRRLIGWSEILEGGLAPNAAVMDWIGGSAQATKEGHDVVMSPTGSCYFDYPYTQTNSKRVYDFNPLAGLTPQQAKHVLGIQASFWSHIDREPALVDGQIYPRLLSLAERTWSPASVSDWRSFEPRIKANLAWLSRFGIAFQENAW
jgi:hexosaminidase